MNYKIYPVYLGYNDVDIANAFWRRQDGTKYRLTCGAFVLQNESGDFLLVDSGIPTNAEIQDKGLPHRQMLDEKIYMDEIRTLGVDPLKVKTIILTHLHWDHAWNLHQFPNAKIYVQRREMEHAIAPLKHERNSYSLVPGNEGMHWLGVLARIIPVEGAAEICEGIRVLPAPGHTPGSQSVMIDTKDGVYGIIGDFAISRKNYEECVPVGSIHSMLDWYETYEKLKKIDFIPLTPHDEEIYEQKVYG